MAPPAKPTSSLHTLSTSSRAASSKRDSLAAELERDPELSSAKRKQRTQAFASNLSHASLERQLAASQSTRIEIEAKLREKDIAIERLENDRRWFADREQEERQEKERERREHGDEKRSMEAELRSLKSSLATLREQYAELQDTHSDLARTSSQSLAKQKSQISTLGRQMSTLTLELDECKNVSEDRRIRCHEMEEQLEVMRGSQTPSTSSAVDADMALVRDELHRQAAYMAKLEKTNTRLESQLSVLRDQHASVEVLREEKRALEKRARMFDQAQERAVRLEAEVEAAKREREQWQRLLAESTAPSNTPVSLSQSLSTLRLEHTHLLEEHGANVVALRQSEAKCKAEEQRATETNQRIQQLNDNVHVLEGRIRRREQRIFLLERETGFLKALMASFAAENNIGNQDPPLQDEHKDQRVRELESLLSEYKSTNDTLIKQLDEIRHDNEIRAAESNPEPDPKYLDKIEELEQKLFDLGGEIGAGRHVPPGVRILSFKANPEQEWFDLRQSAMDRLRGENDALIRRLKELEAAGTGAGPHSGHEGVVPLVPRESWELVCQEKAELEELVAQKEKRLQRLQEVFGKKGKEFREAIASILGVKFAFYPNGQIRVTSIFDLSASFVFQPTITETGESGRMQLIAQGEGGPEEIPQLMRHWLEQEQCLPCFMAGVTMECYDRAIREGKLPPDFGL